MTSAFPPCPHLQWSDLPALPLYSIASRLPSLADFHAFSRVCTSWTSASSDAKPDFMTHLSPLVLCDATAADPACEESDYTLYSIHDQRFYTARLRHGPADPRTRCVGFSDGYLVMLDKRNRCPLLVNPFTGAQLSFPEAPSPVDTAELLTLADGDHLLVALMSPRGVLQCCRPGESSQWIECETRCCVWCVAACGGKVYALVNEWRLATLDFGDSVDGNPTMTVNFLEASPLPGLFLPDGSAALVESNGDLLAVVTITGQEGWSQPPKTVEVLRFDIGACRWARTRTLNGSSLFLGNLLHAMSDADPAAWGGEGDCVYFTNFWRCSRSLYRLRVDTGEVEDLSVAVGAAAAGGGGNGDGLEKEGEEGAATWNFCVWVFPKLCY